MKYEFLDKAKENLAAAKICFDNGFYNACANRAYYAAFQAAVSALADRGIKREKLDHKWVQAEFNGKLIKRRKIYPGRMKSHLVKMQIVRDRADYSTQKVNKKAAQRQIGRVEDLITHIEKELKNDKFQTGRTD
ncbi:HEPN domain-containing protein [Desulfobacterales bacterium HSG16]|nr:HEPN domain-containing protein [Desulfobacterales bacterium HSG16]